MQLGWDNWTFVIHLSCDGVGLWVQDWSFDHDKRVNTCVGVQEGAFHVIAERVSMFV